MQFLGHVKLQRIKCMLQGLRVGGTRGIVPPARWVLGPGGMKVHTQSFSAIKRKVDGPFLQLQRW